MIIKKYTQYHYTIKCASPLGELREVLYTSYVRDKKQVKTDFERLLYPLTFIKILSITKERNTFEMTDAAFRRLADLVEREDID